MKLSKSLVALFAVFTFGAAQASVPCDFGTTCVFPASSGVGGAIAYFEYDLSASGLYACALSSEKQPVSAVIKEGKAAKFNQTTINTGTPVVIDAGKLPRSSETTGQIKFVLNGSNKTQAGAVSVQCAKVP